MPDDNPFLAALAASQQGSDTQVPLDPQQQSVPAVPDTSNLPANSGPVPQPPAVPQQPPAQDSGGYRGPRPILLDLLSGLAHPRTIPGQVDSTGAMSPSRPVSRAATFEDFLGNFISAVGKGFEASGHGPGAFARGFGGAVGAPLQMQQQQQQFGQQQQMGQAQIEAEQAQTAQRQKQTELAGSMVTIQTPNGPMSLPYNVALQSGLLKGAVAAQIGAQNKLTIAELNNSAKSGAVKFIKPVQDPQTGKVVFGAYDAQGNFLKPLDNSIDPSALPKFNKQWQPDGNGGLVLTQQSVSGPALPSAGGTVNRIPQPGAAPSGGSAPSAPKVASVGGKPVGPLWTRPDSLGFTPDSSQLGLTQKEKQAEYNRRQDSYKKNADDLSKTEGTFNQFGSILNDINSGKDITGAQSVVALFNAIGISATPLKGAGFRINSNTITEHEEARGLGQSLYQKLLSLKNGDVITPQQVKDYANIANQAREDQYVNLANQVHNSNLNADFVLPQGNGRQIDPSTARIFLRLTGADNQGRGGNADKARAAAKAKGWRF